MAALAPDLSAVPDADLCRLAAAGDAGAADALVRRHEGMVKSLVRRLKPPPRADRDDLLQAGRLALLKACRGWSRDHGTKFSTYAYAAVGRAVLSELSAQLAGPAPLGVDPDLLPCPEAEPPPDVGPLLARLPPLMRGLVRAYFGLDGSPVRLAGGRRKGEPGGFDLLAARYGLSRAQCAAVLDLALAELRAA